MSKVKFCAPGKGDTISCFSLPSLKRIANNWNSKNPNELISMSSDKATLWNRISQKLRKITKCPHEWCWLDSNYITDLNDVITSSWALNMDDPKPLRIVGPEGTKETVARILHFLDLDIGYRLAHHDDLNEPPQVEVTEVTKGSLDLSTTVSISTAPTDHRPVDPTIAFRFDYQESSVVVAGDTVPCTDLDQLCNGAKALVHTAIRKDIIETLPLQRAKDILNYHSSVEEAAQTAQRAGMEMLILTHYVPGIPPAENEFHELVVQQWRDRAAENFSGKIEIGDDLLKISL